MSYGEWRTVAVVPVEACYWKRHAKGSGTVVSWAGAGHPKSETGFDPPGSAKSHIRKIRTSRRRADARSSQRQRCLTPPIVTRLSRAGRHSDLANLLSYDRPADLYPDNDNQPSTDMDRPRAYDLA